MTSLQNRSVPVSEERVVVDTDSQGNPRNATYTAASKEGDSAAFQRVTQSKTGEGKDIKMEAGVTDSDMKAAERFEKKVDEGGKQHIEYASKLTGPGQDTSSSGTNKAPITSGTSKDEVPKLTQHHEGGYDKDEELRRDRERKQRQEAEKDRSKGEEKHRDVVPMPKTLPNTAPGREGQHETTSNVETKEESLSSQGSSQFNTFEIAFDVNGKEVCVDGKAENSRSSRVTIIGLTPSFVPSFLRSFVPSFLRSFVPSLSDPVFHVLRYTVESHKATDKHSERARVEIKLDAHKPWTHLVQGRSKITLIEAGGKALEKPIELSQGRQNWEIREGRGWVWVIREDSPFAPTFKKDRLVLRVEHESVPRLRAFMERKHHRFLHKLMP